MGLWGWQQSVVENQTAMFKNNEHRVYFLLKRFAAMVQLESCWNFVYEWHLR